MNERSVDWKTLLNGIGLLGWVALLAVALAVIIAVRALLPLGVDLVAGGGPVAIGADTQQTRDEFLARTVERYQANFVREAERFNGRSVFFVPPVPVPPPPPPLPPVERPVVEPRDPGPPPPPTRYGGPGIVYVWDDEVKFDNDMVLKVGGEGQSGVEVLSTDLPWSVKVRWREVEFDVQLFERTTPQFLVPREQNQGNDNDNQADERSGDL